MSSPVSGIYRPAGPRLDLTPAGWKEKDQHPVCRYLLSRRPSQRGYGACFHSARRADRPPRRPDSPFFFRLQRPRVYRIRACFFRASATGGGWRSSRGSSVSHFLTIVPTDLYINGFHYYSFGRIARTGMLFHFFSATVAFTVLYCLSLLYPRHETDRRQSKEKPDQVYFRRAGISPPSFLHSRSFRSAVFPSTRWGISVSSLPFFSPSAS